MTTANPFDAEQDPNLEVTLKGDAVEVHDVEHLESVEEFKAKLKGIRPSSVDNEAAHGFFDPVGGLPRPGIFPWSPGHFPFLAVKALHFWRSAVSEIWLWH